MAGPLIVTQSWKERLMYVRQLLVVATTALLGGLVLVTPAAAHVLAQPDPASLYTLTAGRLWSVVAALVGLTGVVVGGLALARSGRIGTGTGRRVALVALAAGLAGAAIGGLVVAAAEGGPGTGYGIVGGYVALAVGLLATVLGGLALARVRRTGVAAARCPTTPTLHSTRALTIGVATEEAEPVADVVAHQARYFQRQGEDDDAEENGEQRGIR